MASSLIKYSKQTKRDGQSLFWDRAEIDGLPFRGSHAPVLTEGEMDERVVRVADAKNAFFDVTDAAQNKSYLEVTECCFNGWFQLIHIERFWRDSTKHYVEWVEYYMEDGSRTPFAAATKISYGQQDFLGNPGEGASGTG